jgi:hypothetical protein
MRTRFSLVFREKLTVAVEFGSPLAPLKDPTARAKRPRPGRPAGGAARTHGPQTSVGADPAAPPLFPAAGSSIRLVVSGPSVSVWIPKHEVAATARRAIRESCRPTRGPSSRPWVQSNCGPAVPAKSETESQLTAPPTPATCAMTCRIALSRAS